MTDLFRESALLRLILVCPAIAVAVASGAAAAIWRKGEAEGSSLLV